MRPFQPGSRSRHALTIAGWIAQGIFWAAVIMILALGIISASALIAIFLLGWR